MNEAAERRSGSPVGADAVQGGLRTLLRNRELAPLLAAQAAGAFNDNLLKNALAVLAVFGVAHRGPGLSALAGALLVAPYVVLSATAGELADRFDKTAVMRAAKLAEVALMALAVIGLLLPSIPFLLTILFGLGVEAAVFGPVKYAILPERLRAADLVAANGLVEAATFGAILVGTIAGGALPAVPHGSAMLALVGLTVAAAGAVAAFALPRGPVAAPRSTLTRDPLRATRAIVGAVRARPTLWRTTLGLSWFWALGAALLAEFPSVVRDELGGGPSVVTLLLAVFAIGTAAGSLGCARMLRGVVTPRLVPFAAIGITVFLADFAWTAAQGRHALPDLRAVLHAGRGWRLLVDLACVAACGGVFSVSLYALLQDGAPSDRRARTVAANNVVNAVAMVVGAGAIALAASVGLSPSATLIGFAAANAAVAAWIVRLLPHEVWRTLFRCYFRVAHRVTVRGLEHYRAAGPRTVLVANHLSFLDAALIASCLPDSPVFAINASIATRRSVRVFLAAVDWFPLDMANPQALRRMVDTVRDDGRKLIIFPEGRITVTGGLMKIFAGAAAIADHAGARLLPVVLDGPQFTPFSRMRGRLRRRVFAPFSVTFFPAVEPVAPGTPTGPAKRRRDLAGRRLHALMVDAAFRARPTERTLFAALLDARDRFGARTAIVEDGARRPLPYGRLVLAAAVLGRALRRDTGDERHVALMLPNAVGLVAAFFGLQAFAVVPCLLNWSAGAEAVIAACRAADARTVVTSRVFVERGALDDLVERLLAAGLRLVWLEDLRAGLGLFDRVRGILDARRARRLPGARGTGDTDAVVLFTSGSEGAPKGVVHTHRSLLANCAQLTAVIDFTGADRLFNAMPCFHSLGLTGGTLLPILGGVPVFLYPSPLHYRLIPGLIYDTDTTIVFGTDTFLNGWARHADPYDFRAVRYVFGGAERIADGTRRLFADRFGVRLFEGYGTTETAPVISINNAFGNRPGSVGRFLPGITHRLEPVDGIADGARLHVAGPNLMRGYLDAAAPGVLRPCGAEYDTGDIVVVDEDGFIHIRGRARRFAKIGGEMVSMVAVENDVGAVWPEHRHAVIAIPDPRKGEALLLVSERPDPDGRALLAAARTRGVPELAVPRHVLHVDALPLLATGKIDYPAVTRLVLPRLAPDAAAAQRDLEDAGT